MYSRRTGVQQVCIIRTGVQKVSRCTAGVQNLNWRREQVYSRCTAGVKVYSCAVGVML